MSLIETCNVAFDYSIPFSFVSTISVNLVIRHSSIILVTEGASGTRLAKIQPVTIPLFVQWTSTSQE